MARLKIPYESLDPLTIGSADDESKVVTFEFDADGKYRGLSYYFGPGVGCGFCYDSKVGSTVRRGE